MSKKTDQASLCPVRSVLTDICNKWSILVLNALGDNGAMRFGELSKELGDVSQRMLTVTLRALVADGILSRRMYREIPPRVEYDLTDLGRELLPNVRCLIGWAAANMDKITANREQYEE